MPVRYPEPIIAICAVLVQLSVLGPWSHLLPLPQLVTVLSIWMVVTHGLAAALRLAVTAALLLDVYSAAPFGVYSFSLLATVLLADLLFQNFFTNRSLYSLVTLGLGGVWTALALQSMAAWGLSRLPVGELSLPIVVPSLAGILGLTLINLLAIVIIDRLAILLVTPRRQAIR